MDFYWLNILLSLEQKQMERAGTQLGSGHYCHHWLDRSCDF